MEPSNKANTVCVQLLRPCNSSEGVQDSFFFHKMDTLFKVRDPQKPYPFRHPYLPTLYKGLFPPPKDSHVSRASKHGSEFGRRIPGYS